MEPFSSLVQRLNALEVRFVLIGVGGVNFYSLSGSTSFATRDRDLFLPLDASNLVRAWEACTAENLSLTAGREPLDMPRDLWLAERVVRVRALTRASDGRGLEIDLTLVMAGFEFEEVWRHRRHFPSDGVDVPVAKLEHIVRSKASVGREKDRLFLVTYDEALRSLLEDDVNE